MKGETFFVPPPRLVHEHVVLEALGLHHAIGLYEVGSNPSIWEWLTRSELDSIEDAEGFIREASELRDSGDEFPLVVKERSTGRVAGSTRYMEISNPNRSLEIGWTWYGVDYQRTAVNTECKLLLMTYAFESLKAVRVQLKTDRRNLRSQAAIQRIGAKYEGILRKHRVLPKDQFVRDTVYFSVIDDEWPEVKTRLLERLAQPR